MIRKLLGMDLADFIIHLAVTISVLVLLDMTDAPEALFPMTVAASFVAWGLRRKRNMQRWAEEGDHQPAGRMLELEERVQDLENLQGRVLELEERLDFAERLLTRQQEPGQLPR